MKKKWGCLIVSLILSLSLSILSMHFTKGVSKEGKAQTRNIEEMAQAGHWDAARGQTEEIKAYFEEKEGALQVFLCHQDVDQVRRAILEVEAAVKDERVYETVKGCTLLLDALDHLHHRDDAVLSNVL